MIITKIVGFGILASIIAVILKEQTKEISLIVIIASTIMLLFVSLNYIKPIVSLITNIVSTSSIDNAYIVVILKIIGISYMIEFGKDICLDAGQNAIANKMEIAGKVIIVSLSLPIIASILETIENLV